jgi:N-sulfoglucosamine sulfohydrolase
MNRLSASLHAVLVGVCFLLVCFADFVASAAEARPNFVICIADDLACDDLGAYGNSVVRTPHIDRLAAEGLRFERAYLTCSSCSPSRASILTGRYPHSTGAPELHQPLSAKQILLFAPLRENGYFTAAAGKWHLGGAVKPQLDVVREGGGPSGSGEWLSVIRERPRDRPFCLWLAAFDAHRPYPEDGAEPRHAASDVVVPPIFPDVPAVRQDLADYYDEVARFDDSVGAAVEELRQQEVLDRTVVIVLSDNGRAFPRCKTTVYEDGVRTPLIVRYPPLVQPGVTSALVSSIDLAPTILELAGLDPAAPIPNRLQGSSIVPILKNPEESVREYAFSEHNWHDYRAFERAVTDGQYRLVRNWVTELPRTPPADAVRSPTFSVMREMFAAGTLPESQALVFQQPCREFELYDVAADPHCLHDLSTTAAHRETHLRLSRALADWQTTTMDRFPGVESLTPDRYDRQTGELP